MDIQIPPHSHCPDRCEHPQPFLYADKLVCGRCLIRFGEVVEMVPCTTEICHDLPLSDVRAGET